MPFISTIYDGAVHVSLSGCLAAFLFKQTIMDRTTKAIKEADHVTASLVASELCFNTAVLLLASHKTARILLGKDNKPDLAPPINENNLSAAISLSSNLSSTSTPNNATTPPLLPSSPMQRPKRHSLDSDITLVDNDDDFAGDPPGTSDLLPLGSTPEPSIATPRLKPPEKKRYQSSPPGKHKIESRASRLDAVRDSIISTHNKHLDYISELEQLHAELLIDQAKTVDGWAAAMAQLGLTSMLSPPLKTPA
ncbi:hypothetical protein DEU56DRAFT_916750 [Suillus clintonianus]|uniref:uncharacterized protein n=1 Tax=Suillus clintonianus TaxID=1904413 RepID=UPI001B86100E|nr:uncharacterized protein DEU56DRAFT_916750 [Suillus clintonianus]KAG2125020.1 hypothetical protein DEU56DRAFT_916750 [Suillus clintonianus]